MANILNTIYGTKTLPTLFLIFFLYISKLEFPSWNKYPERKKKIGTAIVANLPPIHKCFQERLFCVQRAMN